MDVQIRPARTTDAPAVWELNTAEMGYDFPLEETARRLALLTQRASDRVFIAETDGAVVGYIHAADYELLYAPPYKNVLGIAVARAYQRRGIGRLLLQAVEQWARQTGAQGVRLCSGESRRGAHAFYERCGYTRVKRQWNFQRRL